MPDEKPLGLRLPYATINYETAGSVERGKSPIIHFAVKNTVSMDEAIKSVEVATSPLLLKNTQLIGRLIDCAMRAEFFCHPLRFSADHSVVL